MKFKLPGYIYIGIAAQILAECAGPWLRSRSTSDRLELLGSSDVEMGILKSEFLVMNIPLGNGTNIGHSGSEGLSLHDVKRNVRWCILEISTFEMNQFCVDPNVDTEISLAKIQ